MIYDAFALKIQDICRSRGIETLVHFTRIENINSILREGLIGRRNLELSGQDFLYNDEYRADNYPEAVSLSISFPNYQMFYRIREQRKTEGVNDSQWVVLLLDVKVLWELDCAFCQQNAASNAVRSIPLDERKKPEALKGMFDDFYDIKREDLLIPQNYTTHPQAEVLVFDQIPTQYIHVIHFWDATSLDNWRSNFNGTFSDKLTVKKEFFKPRSDYKLWQSNSSNDDGTSLVSEGDNEEHNVSDNVDDDIPF